MAHSAATPQKQICVPVSVRSESRQIWRQRHRRIESAAPVVVELASDDEIESISITETHQAHSNRSFTSRNSVSPMKHGAGVSRHSASSPKRPKDPVPPSFHSTDIPVHGDGEDEEDEDGIPLAVIAGLTAKERVSLGKLKKVSRGLNEEILRLERLIDDTDDVGDDVNDQLNERLAEYSLQSEKILDAIYKLCHLDGEEDEDGEDLVDGQPFRFDKSGHERLDEVLTALVQHCFRRESSTHTSSFNLPLNSCDELSEEKISSLITALSKEETNNPSSVHLKNPSPELPISATELPVSATRLLVSATRLLVSATRLPISAATVFEDLHSAIRLFRSRLFNQRVIPTFTLKGERNPDLPNDPQLEERLLKNGKLVDERVREYVLEFEEMAKKRKRHRKEAELLESDEGLNEEVEELVRKGGEAGEGGERDKEQAPDVRPVQNEGGLGPLDGLEVNAESNPADVHQETYCVTPPLFDEDSMDSDVRPDDKRFNHFDS